MATIKETDWLGADDFEQVEDMAALMSVVMTTQGNRCVVCGSERPIDVAWPTYAMQLQHIASGDESPDIEYVACPAHEGQVDAMLDKFGAE